MPDYLNIFLGIIALALCLSLTEFRKIRWQLEEINKKL